MSTTSRPSSSPDNLPVTVYTPESELSHPARLVREMVEDFFKAWELSMVLFKRNMMAQFRQSILGYAWLFFPPLATTAVWFFLNGSGVVTVAETPIPYPAFVLIGTLLWQAFLDSMNKPINALNGARPMLIKLKFPREAPVIAGIAETAVTSAVRLILLVPVFIFVEVSFSWTLVLFPLGYLAMLLLGLAIGVLLAPLGLLYGDIGRAINIVGQILMYLTPVVYPFATGGGVLSLINRLNPITYVLETARATIAGGPFEYLGITFVIVAAATLLLFLGWAILRITLPRIIERMGM